MLLSTGGEARAPFTLWPRLAGTASCAKSASVVPSATLMVPPLRVSALAAMLIPSVSRSLSRTM